MTESEDALRAALEAAGLSLQAIPEEQRSMFTSLTDEEVTRLIKLCAGEAGEVGGTGGTGPDPVPPDSSGRGASASLGPAAADPATSEPRDSVSSDSGSLPLPRLGSVRPGRGRTEPPGETGHR